MIEKLARSVVGSPRDAAGAIVRADHAVGPPLVSSTATWPEDPDDELAHCVP